MLVAAPVLSAQVLYGILTGTVTDNSGAAVPGATVTVRNQNNGETRTLKMNGSGEYTIRDLEAGFYTIDIPASGSFGGFKQETSDWISTRKFASTPHSGLQEGIPKSR